MSEQSARRSQVDYRSQKMRASSLIVLVETLKDWSPKPTKLCVFELKIKKNCRFQNYARSIVFYRRIENSEITNQICGFPIENSWLSTKFKYLCHQFNPELLLSLFSSPSLTLNYYYHYHHHHHHYYHYYYYYYLRKNRELASYNICISCLIFLIRYS